MTSPAASTNQTTETAKYHEHYSDPSDDTVLRSEDGILFRASSYRLSKASTMFAGMFEAARARGSTVAHNEVIDVACDSQMLEAFLDMIHQTASGSSLNPRHVSPLIFAKSSFPVVVRLRELAEYYDVAAWVPVLERAIQDAYTTQPTTILAHAGRMRDVTMARKALEEINASHAVTHTYSKLVCTMEQLPLDWQTHLYDLLLAPLGSADEIPQGGCLVIRRDWSSIAEYFDPPAPKSSNKTT